MNSKAKKPDSLRPASPPPLPVVNSDTDRFNKAIRISLVIHGFLFIGSVFSHLFWGSNPKNYAPSVRVDLVGLPDLKKSDLNKAQANADLEALKKKLNAVDEAIKQEAAKAPRKPIEVVKKPEPPSDMVRKATMKEDRRKNLSSAIERIKALQAMEKA